MKVLFVCPPTSQEERYGKLKDIGTLHPSLGIGYVAAFAEQKGHDVRILDCEALDYNYEDVKKYIEEFKPDVIGMQTFCTNLHKCYKISEIAKTFDKNIKTVLGGAHATVFPKESISNDYIDFVIYGEGEQSFANLLKELESKMDFI